METEKKVKMKSVSGKVDFFPESEVEHRKFYGWTIVPEYQIADCKLQIADFEKMTKDQINDWAAEHLPGLKLDPSQMKKCEMIDKIKENDHVRQR